MKKLCTVIFVTMTLLTTAISFGADGHTKTGMTGTFLIKPGLPMSGAMFYVYNLATGPAPSRDKYWRVPDHAEMLKEDGSFNIELPEGVYCIGAVQRVRGTTRIGPPENGDFFLLSFDEKGEPKKYQVKKGQILDIGKISGARQIRSPFLIPGTTAIEGIIQDIEGKPVEGAMAFAFPTPTIVGKPLFISERSCKAGKFVLRVPEGGTYYIKIRDDFGGGPPRAGKVLDGNKEEPMSQVTVKTGETANIGILKVKKFPGRGPNMD